MYHIMSCILLCTIGSFCVPWCVRIAGVFYSKWAAALAFFEPWCCASSGVFLGVSCIQCIILAVVCDTCANNTIIKIHHAMSWPGGPSAGVDDEREDEEAVAPVGGTALQRRERGSPGIYHWYTSMAWWGMET